MIDDELLAKFDRIQDLPISEELLGAYAEGNVTDSEQMLISSITDSSSEISTLLSELEEWEDVLVNDLSDFNQIDLMAATVEELPNIDDYSLSHNYEETSFGMETIGTDIIDSFDSSSLDSNISSDVSPLENENFFMDGDSSQQEEHSLDTNSDSEYDTDIDFEGNDFNNLDF